MNIQNSDTPNSAGQEAGCITELLNNFSLETTPSGAKKIEKFSNFVRPNTTVFITFLPGTDYNETVLTAKKLRIEGLNPAPHFAARSIDNAGCIELLLFFSCSLCSLSLHLGKPPPQSGAA